MSGQIFSGSLDPSFNPFEDDYLAQILEATALAWKLMRHPTASETEDRITYRLAGRIQNDPQFADLPYEVVPQYWLLGLDGDRLGRLDLFFKHRYSRRDYFAFESKRLHVTYPKGKFSSQYSEYAGADGMMAFIEGYYSKDLPAGGMLGYIMDGKVIGARNGLAQQIDSHRITLKLINGSHFRQSALRRTIAKGMQESYLGETNHDLATHQLRIFHLLLPVHYGYAGTGS